MEIDVEEDEPDDVVGESELEEPLDGEAPVEAVEGNEAVYDVGDDPLLDESHEEVGSQNHLQRPSEEEKLAYSVRLREVELVAESGGEEEVVDVGQSEIVGIHHDVLLLLRLLVTTGASPVL